VAECWAQAVGQLSNWHQKELAPDLPSAGTRDMWFELIGPITDMESIATGSAIREIQRLRKHYGRENWKKRKGIGTVRLHDGTICRAELHWYEAHGVGRKEMKIKHLLE
jgi:hypothetical protein